MHNIVLLAFFFLASDGLSLLGESGESGLNHGSILTCCSEDDAVGKMEAAKAALEAKEKEKVLCLQPRNCEMRFKDSKSSCIMCGQIVVDPLLFSPTAPQETCVCIL